MKNQLIHLFTFIRNIRFNKFNLFVIHFAYIKNIILKLTLRKYSASGIHSARPVFILNACINPYDSLQYANYAAPNDVCDRFRQVMNGIKSVKENFIDSDIVYIENSNIPVDFESQLKSSVDFYFNFSNNNFLQYSRAISNKGVPWSISNLLCLIELNKIKHYTSYHFLNARYEVSTVSGENFHSNTREGYMHVKMKQSNITLLYFYFSGVSLRRIFSIFKFAHLCSVSGFSIEDLFSVFFFKKRYLSTLGISGKINSVYNCEE